MSNKIERKRHHGPSHHMGLIEKPKDFKGTFKKLLKYMDAYIIAFTIVIICAVGSTVFNILGPKIMGNVTNEIADGLMSKISGGRGVDFGAIEKILFIMITLYLISAFLGFVSGQITAVVSQKITYKMRRDISEKINRLPMSFFDKHNTGETLSIIVNDVDTLGMSLNQSLMQLITSFTTIVGIIIMMLTISVPMTLIALCVLPVSGILIGIIVKKSQKFFKSQQDYLGNVNGIVEENFAGQQIVKLFNREEKVLEEFNKSNAKLYKSSWKAQFLSGLMMPLMMFVGNLAYVAIVVSGGFFVIDGKIKVGAIQSFIGYIKNFTQPISQLAQVSNMFQSAIACSERIFTFLEEEEETADGELSVENYKGEIEFKNVSFGYVEDKTVINNFSAKFNAGEQVAIVGPTGAGKTTIVNLLMRFYEINSGSITLDGIDIRKYKRAELRKQFAMVLQNPWLFSGTIMENLRYGNLEATDEQVIESAKFAHAHRFISLLPEQYNTLLNEETNNISAGQRQLLTIARSNLANAPITILDEATSSVDTTTEQRIQRGMEKLTWGRTSFIIAHRLSTIKNADTILVLKDGDIIEKGNHETLLAQKGFYSELYNSQFEATA